MRLFSEKVLRKIEDRIEDKIPPEILSAFRYDLKDVKISRRNLKSMSISLSNFLNSIESGSYYPIREKKLSLFSSVIQIKNKKDDPHHKIIGLYVPGGTGNVTAQIKNLKVLKVFENELDFFQETEGSLMEIPFDQIDFQRDVISVSKSCFKGSHLHIVIHYVPSKK